MSEKKPKIVMVGVGRAGTKIANIITGDRLSEDIKTITVSAFEYQTKDLDTDTKIVLYKGLPAGLRPGPIPPSEARDAAIEAFDEIKEALKQ